MFERLKWLLPALTLFIALGLLSVSARQQGRGTTVTNALLEVVGPVEKGLISSIRGVDSIWRHYFYLVHLSQENEALKEVVARQARQLVELAEIKAANDRLNSLLELRESYPNLIIKAAHVLAWDPGPWYRTVVISLGSNDGLRINQAVFNAQGAVGRVVSVSANYSRVLLATDYTSSIDSFIQRSRAVGILRGQGARQMSLNYVRKDEDVRTGDQVVTSGLDGFFPKGLLVGTVTKVNRQAADMFMEVEVSPAVPFDRLEEVLVAVNSDEPIDWLVLGPRLRPLIEDAEEAQRRLLTIESNQQPESTKLEPVQ